MENEFIDRLSRSEQNHHVIYDNKGGHAVILERGSRLLELIPANRQETAFWTNISALETNEWNIGGDRSWIAPELDYFMNEHGTYEVPIQLDPGHYQFVSFGEDTVKTAQECIVTHRSSRSDVKIKIEKDYAFLCNPLSMHSSTSHLSFSNTSYIGIQVSSKLSARSNGDHSLECNLWTITQVPANGRAIIPTIGHPEPLIMYGQNERIDMDLHPNYVDLSYTGEHRYKISLQSLQSAGRFGYVLPVNSSESSLIVRQFSVSPSGVYRDYPPFEKDYLGSCMQFFFDGGQLGGFGELEYHTPTTIDDGQAECQDISQLYYYVGKSDEIAEIAYLLLGIHL